MKIVKQDAFLEGWTPDPRRLIERAGRTCYRSEDKVGPGSDSKFIQMLIVSPVCCSMVEAQP